jgi:hypothetical protein
MTFHQIFPDIVYKTKIADSEIIKKKFANKIINKFIHDPNEKFVGQIFVKHGKFLQTKK